MLSNNTFLETRIQRLLDGLIFNENELGVYVQRMLKMSRVFTLAEIFSKIFVKNTMENWGPYLRSWFDKEYLAIRHAISLNEKLVLFC